MSAMSDSIASSGPLTSPSPSPPPPPSAQPSSSKGAASPKKPPSTAKAAGLDSSSELSELTEDEQDAAGHSRSRASSGTPHRQDTASRRVPRRKRSGIVPESMWGWAYKANGRKSQDEDDDDEDEDEDDERTNAATKNANAGASTDHANDAAVRDEDNDKADEPYEYDDTFSVDDRGDADLQPDSDEEGDEQETGAKPAPTVAPLNNKTLTRDSSMALTEEDADHNPNTYSDYSMESEEEEDPREEDEEDDPAGDAGDDGEDGEEGEANSGGAPAKNVDTAPVVPLAPAASSIMAGQQLIKTPSPSPSTSPEPEDEAAEEPANALSEKANIKAEPVETETVAGVGRDEDPDRTDQADVEHDADLEAEVEAEEAELELQPAHRAEALDVLAQIELRFALVREALYVEKMEDLAMEEALVLQGQHPEMIHLQNELQSRHDRRLDLAAKKRKYEDDHVTLMRKVDENGVWSWWKHERDELQTEMFAEANRKRRRLEREKRALDRPPIPKRVPQPSASRIPSRPLSIRELVKFASLDASHDRSKLKRKRREPPDPDQGYAYPALSVLSSQDIQSDLQLLAAPRARAYHGPVMGGEMGPGIAGPMGPGFEQHQHYMEYNGPPGMGPPGHGHGPPQFVHGLSAPMSVHHPYGPPPPGRPYHHQQPGGPGPGAPPPMGSIQQHSGARAMQGPGAPPSMGGYLPHGAGGRQHRRSPSPPPPGYEHGHGGVVNGGQGPYGPTTGPGQHWASVPSGPNANVNASNGAGPSKPPGMNGYAKEHGHRRDVRERERERERERDGRLERDRERERIWHENNAKEAQAQDELGRLHTPHLHRSSHLHQQGVPHHHHHHVVHRGHNPNAHHHHPPPGRVPPGQLEPRRTHDLEHEPGSRHGPPPTIEQINLLAKPLPSSPYWKENDEREHERERERDKERDRDRDRERGRTVHMASGPPPMHQLGPPPNDRERPQVTPFVMTPSQAMQAGFNPPRVEGGGPSRANREPWLEERERSRFEQPDGPGFGHPSSIDGPSRRGHATHSRQSSSTTLNGISSPHPRNGTMNGISSQSPPPPPQSSVPLQPSGPGMGPAPPPAFTPGLLQSPSRLSNSLHASPRASAGASTPKGTGPRPISPLAVSSKLLSSAPSYAPAGPGTPGGAGSRLGTPALAGPGTPLNGHGHGHGLGLTHGPGVYPGPGTAGLTGPAQPLIPPAGDLAPPKMTAVQLGNGS